MKNKLLFGFLLLFVSGVTATATFAFTEEEAASRYDTVICNMSTQPVPAVWGSQCSTPVKSGPCTRTSACHY